METKKTIVYGKIENKYNVTTSKGILLESIIDGGPKYPILFNSDVDAIYYLINNNFEGDDNIKIENDKSYFYDGAILIDIIL